MILPLISRVATRSGDSIRWVRTAKMSWPAGCPHQLPRMGSPASYLGQIGDRAACRLQDHALLTYPVERLHRYRVNHVRCSRRLPRHNTTASVSVERFRTAGPFAVKTPRQRHICAIGTSSSRPPPTGPASVSSESAWSRPPDRGHAQARGMELDNRPADRVRHLVRADWW